MTNTKNCIAHNPKKENGKLYEFDVVKEFTHKLGLPNKTDGSLFIYKSDGGGGPNLPSLMATIFMKASPLYLMPKAQPKISQANYLTIWSLKAILIM